MDHAHTCRITDADRRDFRVLLLALPGLTFTIAALAMVAASALSGLPA